MLDLVPWERERSLISRPYRSLLDSFFEEFRLPSLFREEEREWIPALDMSETDKEIIVQMEVPGIDPKDIEVTLTNNVLTIKGEKKLERKEEGEDFHRIERRFGTFSRSIRLPVEVNADAVEATYKNGVLKLVLPKTEESRAKRIEVKH